MVLVANLPIRRESRVRMPSLYIPDHIAPKKHKNDTFAKKTNLNITKVLEDFN